jgi:hypothetical protein
MQKLRLIAAPYEEVPKESTATWTATNKTQVLGGAFDIWRFPIHGGTPNQ